MLLPPGYDATALRALLADLLASCAEEDVAEVMAHPGDPFPRSPIPFSRSPDRRAEVEALTAPEVLAFVRESGIRLASFGDLA
jgi:predicted glycoside hydrolase/deacetylase ChbG (UPF0249 family)